MDNLKRFILTGVKFDDNYIFYLVPPKKINKFERVAYKKSKLEQKLEKGKMSDKKRFRIDDKITDLWQKLDSLAYPIYGDSYTTVYANSSDLNSHYCVEMFLNLH